MFLSSSPVFEGSFAPSAFGEPGGGPVQRGGPFVTTDAVPGEVILGVMENPGAETTVEFFKSVAASLIESPEPLPKGTLIGDFLEAKEFEESFVGAEFLDIRKAGST